MKYNEKQVAFIEENATVSTPGYDIHALGCRCSASLWGVTAFGKFSGDDEQEARQSALATLVEALETGEVVCPELELEPVAKTTKKKAAAKPTEPEPTPTPAEEIPLTSPEAHEPEV